LCKTKKKQKNKTIVPDAVSKVKVIARSDSATITWEIPARAEFYQVYLVLQGMLLPINDGAGLNITTNDVTINSVSLFDFFCLFVFVFIYLLKKKKKKKKP